MGHMNRSWTWGCCLLAAGALALAGCPKGDKSKSKSGGKAPTGSEMGGDMGGMGAATPGPRRPGQGAEPGALAGAGIPAGVKAWSPKWPKALKPLAGDAKGALAGDAKGALAHLKVLLFAHYPKYSFKVATDKDLDALKAERHKGQLDKLVEAARVAHVAAWKKVAFFVGANMRAFKYKRSVRGTQEIYGYVPETGRNVGVTYVDAANAVGYLVAPDRQAMIYVAVSKFVSDEGPPAFSDVEVHALSLTTGKRLKVWTHMLHPGGGYHGQVRAAGAAKPREVKPGDAGVVDIKIEQLKSGAYRVSMVASGVGDVADKKNAWDFGLTGDAVTTAPPMARRWCSSPIATAASTRRSSTGSTWWTRRASSRRSHPSTTPGISRGPAITTPCCSSVGRWVLWTCRPRASSCWDHPLRTCAPLVPGR